MSVLELNVNGHKVVLTSKRVRAQEVSLDLLNPRIGFLLSQMDPAERTESAAEFLLHTQEEVARTKKSIFATRGLQEPIFLRHNYIVAEGNRRVVIYRELNREHPNDLDFATMPAWVFPEDTPEHVVQQAINNFHLNGKREWPPFERALVFKRLREQGETLDDLAARFEMKEEEIRQFIEAVELIHVQYLPLLDDPSDPKTREKFSYFLEYARSPRSFIEVYPDLDSRFASWVLNGNIPKAEKVRKLGKILENPNAVIALEAEGFEAALEVLVDENPNENPQFKAFDRATRYLENLNSSDLLDIKRNRDKKNIIAELARSVSQVVDIVGITV